MSITAVQTILWISFSLLILCTALVGIYIFKRFGSPLPRLFFEFDKKMWMTLGLGFSFLALYLFFVCSLSCLSNQYATRIFTFIQTNPTLSIYIGLFIFATLSLSIYLMRILIKYLYRIRNK